MRLKRIPASSTGMTTLSTQRNFIQKGLLRFSTNWNKNDERNRKIRRQMCFEWRREIESRMQFQWRILNEKTLHLLSHKSCKRVKNKQQKTLLLFTRLFAQKREKKNELTRNAICGSMTGERGRDKKSLNNKCAVVWWLNNPDSREWFKSKSWFDVVALFSFGSRWFGGCRRHTHKQLQRKWQCWNFWYCANFMQIMKTFFSYQFTPNKDHPTP